MDNSTSTRTRKEVIQSELIWHEQEAHRRHSLDAFLYDPPAFDAVVQSALAFLQVDSCELVLDMGCGEGKETFELASRGLHVVSTDLSFTQLSRARELIRKNIPDAPVSFIQANAEELPFGPDSFQIIYGKAILHHLDLDISAGEVSRLLKPDGRATFAEPLAQHPLFWMARRISPKLRTKDERPMLLRDLEQYSQPFRLREIESFFFITPCAYLIRALPRGENIFRKVHSVLSKLDEQLFYRFQVLRKFAWYGAIKIQKSK